MTKKNWSLKEKVRYCSCGFSEKVISVSDLLAWAKEKQEEEEKKVYKYFESQADNFSWYLGKCKAFAELEKELEGE